MRAFKHYAIALLLSCPHLHAQSSSVSGPDIAPTVTAVMQLTGADSPNRTDRYDVYGTDLGSFFEHEDKLFIVFGDTFGKREPGKTGAGGEHWRSNVMAYSTDFDPSNGITIDGMITDDMGFAKELVASYHRKNGEITKIPTAGISANGNIYLYFMSVNEWTSNGRWLANYSGVARSTDDGQNFQIVRDLRWDGDSNFIQVAPVEVDDSVYFFSVPSGRHGGVALMRVAIVDIENLDAYEYFAGSATDGPVWQTDPYSAQSIVSAPVGELSVIWNPYLDSWIMTYLNETSHAIEIRSSPSLWGPWSEPRILVTADDYPALYGAYMHPRLTEDNGRVIYFNMSQWGSYNVFLMRAEFAAP